MVVTCCGAMSGVTADTVFKLNPFIICSPLEGCQLVANKMSEGDIILTQFHAGIIMDFFRHPQEGLYVRCQKLDFAPCRSV